MLFYRNEERLSHTTPDRRLIRRKISTPRHGICGSPVCARQNGLPTSPAEPDGHAFVTYRPKGEAGASETWILRHAPAAGVVRPYAGYDLLYEAIAEGTGLGILNLRVCEGDARLTPCFEPIAELDQEHLLLVAPASYRRPEVRPFVKFFAPRDAATFR